MFVLSRENAVEGWREMIGDVDPNKAKVNQPESYVLFLILIFNTQIS